MDEILLLKISLSISLIGILTLFFIATSLDEDVNLDRSIILQGYVEQITQYEKNSILKLTTPKTEDIVVFETGFEIKQGDLLEIRGSRKEDQIYATDIYLLK